MRVRTYIYNADRAPDHVDAVLAALADRDEEIEYQDLAATASRDDAIREAMFTVRESVRIGKNPDGIYDEEGNPDFSAGVLITQEPTGRRSLHIGEDALDVLSQ